MEARVAGAGPEYLAPSGPGAKAATGSYDGPGGPGGEEPANGYGAPGGQTIGAQGAPGSYDAPGGPGSKGGPGETLPIEEDYGGPGLEASELYQPPSGAADIYEIPTATNEIYSSPDQGAGEAYGAPGEEGGTQVLPLILLPLLLRLLL